MWGLGGGGGAGGLVYLQIFVLGMADKRDIFWG